MPGGKWVIAGMDGNRDLFDIDLPAPVMTEPDIVSILQRLVCMHLTPEEIIAASLPTSAASYRGDLEIQREVRKERPSIILSTTGTSYHYAARFEEAEQKEAGPAAQEKSIWERLGN